MQSSNFQKLLICQDIILNCSGIEDKTRFNNFIIFIEKMADLATHSLSYSLENEQLIPFAPNAFDIDEGVYCDFASQNNCTFYQERESAEEEILNNYDTLHWPELGKHVTNDSKIRYGVNASESPEFSDQERIFSFPDEDTRRMKFGRENYSKPQTYASVVQKTLKLKLENNKDHQHNGSSMAKNENGTVLYGSNIEDNNVAVVFNDQKYIFKWSVIDILSQNIPETFDGKEVEYLTQIYCSFMRNTIENLPMCPQGKEVVEFSSLLMLLGSRIEVHDVDGVSELYYCLNKGWTEEDSSIAHKSYLPPYCYMKEYEETQTEENEDEDDDVLSAKAQAVCTYGFDLNTALTISKDLWGWQRPRMPYTQMFAINE